MSQVKPNAHDAIEQSLVPLQTVRDVTLDISTNDLPPRKFNTFVSVIISCQRLVVDESNSSGWSWYSCDKDSVPLFDPIQPETEFYNATAINEPNRTRLQLDLSRFKISQSQQTSMPVRFNFTHKHKPSAFNLFRFVFDIYESKNYVTTSEAKPVFLLSIPKKNEKLRVVEFNQCIIAILRKLDQTNATRWTNVETAKTNTDAIAKLLDTIPNHQDNVQPMKHPRLFLTRQQPQNFLSVMIPKKNLSTSTSKGMFTLTPTSPSVNSLMSFVAPSKAEEPNVHTPAPEEEKKVTIDVPLRKDLLKQFKQTTNKRPLESKDRSRKKQKLEQNTSTAKQEPTVDEEKQIAEALLFMHDSEEEEDSSISALKRTKDGVQLETGSDETPLDFMNKSCAEKFFSNMYMCVDKSDRSSVLNNLATSNSIVRIFYDDQDEDFFCVFDSRFCCSASLVALHVIDEFVDSCGFDSKMLHRSTRKRGKINM